MKRLALALALISFCWNLAGCGVSEGRETAVKQANAFYKAIQGNDYETALTYWHPGMFNQEWPKEKWLAFFKARNEKFGSLKSFEDSGKISFNSAAGKGTTFKFDFVVTYANNVVTDDKVNVLIKGETMQIVSFDTKAQKEETKPE